MAKKKRSYSTTRRNKKKKLKLLNIIILILLIIALVLLGITIVRYKGVVIMNSEINNSEDVVETQDETNDNKEVDTDETQKKVSFLATGDIIAHDSVNMNAYDSSTSKYNYNFLFDDFKSQVQNADIAYTNQETIYTSTASITGYPSFNTPTELIDSIVEAGFDLVSIANNHALDTSSTAPQETTNYYNENYPDVKVAGSNDSCEDLSYQTFEVNGISFTYNAFTYGLNNESNLSNCNVNIIDDENYDRQIENLTSEGDVNIVSVHFGEEDSNVISESDQQIVDNLLSNGVEIIIGTHPHVLKPIEVTTNSEGNDALVAYSLGNLISAQLDDMERVGGILEFDITLEDRVIIDNVLFTPTYQYYLWGDETESDINTRYDLKTVYLTEISDLISNEYYESELEIVKEVIDEKYLPYLPSSPYSDIEYIDSSDFTYETVVNKHMCLGADYEPTDLVIPNVLESTRTTSDVHYISQAIEQNIIEMFEAAEEDGYELVFVSGYRDYATQETLYNNYVASDGVEAADTYSARPGCSEHQTGISFDISEKSVDADGVDAFTGTEAAKWIEDNAYKYGFIVRYPKDKVGVTQYMYESWHLRYVGEDVAKVIHDQNLTLEEYNHLYSEE